MGLALWVCFVGLLFGVCFGADPFANFELELSYITASPLGVPQQVKKIDFFSSVYVFFLLLEIVFCGLVCFCLF